MKEKEKMECRDREFGNTIYLDWAEKYRPNTLSQISGNHKAIEELKAWAQSWAEGEPKEKAVVLYGRSGIGKTTAAQALANDMGWEMIELNASDQRTADIIERNVGLASINNTFDDIKRLIILDEADNIHGTADKGGEKAIVEIILKTKQPLLLIANEFYHMSQELRKSCKSIEFKPVSVYFMVPVLKRITDLEGTTCEQGTLDRLAIFANGDVRGAINDLQSIAQKKCFITRNDIIPEIVGERDTKDRIFAVLSKILKGNDIVDANRSAFDIDEEPEYFIQWIDENLPTTFTNVKDLDTAYYYLSRAATFLGRVVRRQDFSLWRYAYAMMTAGIVISRSSNFIDSKFRFPSIRTKLTQTKGIRNVRDSIAKKIGAYCHVSMRYTRSTLIPFFKLMMEDYTYACSISALLNLDIDEIAYLISDEEKVLKIYNGAQSIISGNDIESYYEKERMDEDEDIDKNIDDKNNKDIKSPQSTLFDF